MVQEEVQTDILIVGAGPVGLFLANECARRGLKGRIIEARSTQSEHSKALAIFPRTLEIFDMAGLVEPFVQTANRVTSVAVMSHGRTLARMRFEPKDSPYPFVAMVPQNVTEKLLVEQLRRRGGTVEYETRFVSEEDRDGHVTATVEHQGRCFEIDALFLVGCDGAHSVVRHLLKVPFEGAEYHDTYVLADVETSDTLPADQLQLCPSEFGPLAIFPMSPTRRRIIATIHDTEGDEPSLEIVRRLLAERGPGRIEARSLNWSTYFRIHHRQVARLQVGRFFVAGDAAHIHSPFGGQGMNTGLQDVWNLAWKLDLVLHGRADMSLLDSYSAERRPVIKDVVETTDFLTKALGTPSKLAQILRDAVIPLVSRLAPFQHAFVRRLSELGVAYHGSPIVEGPGERYFDDSMRGGTGVRSRFLLMIDSDAGSHFREAARQVAQEYSDILELRSHHRRQTILVRPDGYITYASDRRDDVAILRSVRSLLDRQTGRARQKVS